MCGGVCCVTGGLWSYGVCVGVMCLGGAVELWLVPMVSFLSREPGVLESKWSIGRTTS